MLIHPKHLLGTQLMLRDTSYFHSYSVGLYQDHGKGPSKNNKNIFKLKNNLSKTMSLLIHKNENFRGREGKIK